MIISYTDLFIHISLLNISVNTDNVITKYIYCTHTTHYTYYILHILHIYCTHTIHIIHTYCTHTAHILYTYCTHTVHTYTGEALRFSLSVTWPVSIWKTAAVFGTLLWNVEPCLGHSLLLPIIVPYFKQQTNPQPFPFQHYSCHHNVTWWYWITHVFTLWTLCTSKVMLF